MADLSEPLFRELISRVGENPDREGLKETPARMVRAWAEWTAGYEQDPADVLKVFEDGAENYDEMVFQGNIAFYSHCEHHMAPFFGSVHIAYIPNGRVVGLSKLTRLVDIFARRLQVQERMTRQIADALEKNLKPLGVGVVLRARHLCMESRGVRKVGTHTTTSAVLGVFKELPEVRAEFLDLAKLHGNEG